MVALFVSAAYGVQAAALNDQAAAACSAAGNDTDTSLVFLHQVLAINTLTATSSSIQNVLEASSLLIISSAFLLLVPLSVAMFRRAERVAALALLSSAARADAGARRSDGQEVRVLAILDEALQAAVEQRRRLVIACVFVMITFPVRASFDVLNAYAKLLLPH
jgi:hypothetical protein